MKKMRKLLALLLALIMVIGMFAGCAKKEEPPKEEETPAVEEKPADDATTEEAEAPAEEGEKIYTPDEYYVIEQVGGALIDVDSTLETKVGQYIADHFGIVFEYVDYSGDYWEFLTLQLAGGTYGEFVHLQQDPGFKPYAEAGVLLNLDDYKDILPDFYEYYERQIPYWRARTPDGGLYGWDYDVSPTSWKGNVNYWDVAVRSDVLEYYGYPELYTTSDYIEFMEKAIVDFPTALDGSPTTGIEVTFGESYGAAGFSRGLTTDKMSTHYGSNGTAGFDVAKGEYYDQAMESPTMKPSVQFWNECYNKGLLDVESFTDLGDQQSAKMAVGQPIVIFYTAWSCTSANKALTEAGHPEMAYVPMPIMLDEFADVPFNNNGGAPVNFDSTFALTDNCKDPERLLKFINWCCTDEGQTILMSGFEGETYIINEEGKREPTELRYQIATDTELAKEWGIPAKNLHVFPGFPQGAQLDDKGVPYNFGWEQAFLDEAGLTEREKEVYFEGLGWNSSKQFWLDRMNERTQVDTGSITIPGDTDLGKIDAALTECYVRNFAKLIMAEDFEAAWDEFIAEYTQYDWEAVRAEYNRLYQEYVARKEAE